jgi:hypothetical protein
MGSEKNEGGGGILEILIERERRNRKIKKKFKKEKRDSVSLSPYSFFSREKNTFSLPDPD